MTDHDSEVSQPHRSSWFKEIMNRERTQSSISPGGRGKVTEFFVVVTCLTNVQGNSINTELFAKGKHQGKPAVQSSTFSGERCFMKIGCAKVFHLVVDLANEGPPAVATGLVGKDDSNHRIICNAHVGRTKAIGRGSVGHGQGDKGEPSDGRKGKDPRKSEQGRKGERGRSVSEKGGKEFWRELTRLSAGAVETRPQISQGELACKEATTMGLHGVHDIGSAQPSGVS